MSLNVPRINDIATSTDAPPQFVALARLYPSTDYRYPAHFAEKQQGFYRDLKPLQLNLSPEQAFVLIEDTARSQPRWKVISADRQALRLEAVAVTRLCRFRDDVVIEVRPPSSSASPGVEIQMRSRSRLGKSDLGANAARIRAFFSALVQSI